MKTRAWLALFCILFSLILAVGYYGAIRSAQQQLADFRGQICHLSTTSQQNSIKFKSFLGILSDRAHGRERIDRAAGSLTAAQADHDSALLYDTVARSISSRPGPTLGC